VVNLLNCESIVGQDEHSRTKSAQLMSRGYEISQR
jgi:hypothetical protein